MSQENVELAKRFNEVGQRDIEAAEDFVAEDVVVMDFGTRLDTPPVVHGRTELFGYYAQVAEMFDRYVREVDEWVDAGDWVIAVGRWVGKGTASGVPIEAKGVNAARWRDGKIVEYLLGFPTKEAALREVRRRE